MVVGVGGTGDVGAVMGTGYADVDDRGGAVGVGVSVIVAVVVWHVLIVWVVFVVMRTVVLLVSSVMCVLGNGVFGVYDVVGVGFDDVGVWCPCCWLWWLLCDCCWRVSSC